MNIQIEHIKSEDLRRKLIKESLSHKIRNELAFQFDFEPEDIKDHTPLKKIVIALWSMQRNDENDDFDRFDGLYYESEYHVQYLIRRVGDRLNLEFNLDDASPTMTLEKLIKTAWRMKDVD